MTDGPLISKSAAAAGSRPTRFGRYTIGALVLATLIGGFTLFFQLGTAKSLGSHEGYAIIPAREMRRTGDYIVPRFGEMPRLKKPPLIYWAINASGWVTGQYNIFSARLPAALAALMLGGLMAYWGWRWYGAAGAIGAMAAQTTSVYMISYGRKAEADMPLLLLIALALYLFVGFRADESRRTTFWRWVGIWSCVSISWLGKFHFSPAMIFGPGLAWIVLERRWRFLWGLLNPVGLLIFAAAVGIWPAMVLDRLPGAWEIWREETLGRAVGELGRQPVWYYLPHLVSWTLPWTPFAILAWYASWKAAWGANRSGNAQALSPATLPQRILAYWRRVISDGDPRERFLWVWLGVTLAIVTLQANKHPHYILPALPAFSLWTARRFEQLGMQARAGRRLMPASVSIFVTAAVAVGIAVLVFRRDLIPDLPDIPLQIAAGVAGVSAVAVCWLLWARRSLAAGAVAACGWLAAYGIATTVLIPAQDHRLAAYEFGSEARQTQGPAAKIGIHAIDKDAILWYIGEPAFRTETAEQVARQLREEREVWLIMRERSVESLETLGNVTLVDRYEDVPNLPKVELGHYRHMVLVKVSAASGGDGAKGRERTADGGGEETIAR